MTKKRVPAGTPGATKVRSKSRKWYIQYTDDCGRVRRLAASESKPAAQKMLGALVARVELARAGVRDPVGRYRAVPVADHVAAWHAAILARGATARHAKQQRDRVTRLLARAGVRYAGQLRASGVEAALAAMRGAGTGAQTSNHYLSACRQFARWLAGDSRIERDPLTGLRPLNVRVDRRHDRRALAPAELAALFAEARAGKSRLGLPGAARATLYRLAVYTGLRAAELASLTPASFALGGDSPTVRVAAADAKNRTEAALPVHPTLVPELRAMLAATGAGRRVFPGTWAAQRRAGMMLRADLARARKKWLAALPAAGRAEGEASDHLRYEDADGRFADFHALRHTFVENLVASGVNPKTAQRLARHATITLTMDRYSRGGDAGADRAAVGSLSAID